MIKKGEAKEALESLISTWGLGRFPGLLKADDHPSWYEFLRWLDEKHYSSYLNFRSSPALDTMLKRGSTITSARGE